MRTLFFRLPRLAVLAMLVVVAGGLGAVLSLGRQEDPTLIERFGFVLVALPGADAERIEALVTEPLEDALLELAEIEELETVSRAGISQVTIGLREDLSESEVDDAWGLVQAQVDKAQTQFPAGTQAPEIERVFVGATTMAVSIIWTGEGPPELALMARLAATLEDRFQNLPGTEETETYGLPDEEIRVIVDPDALAAAGLTAREAAAIIAASDSKTPAGQLRTTGSNLGVEIDGEFDSIARVRAVPLLQRGDGSAVRVGDVADVRKGLSQPITVLDFDNGRRAITVGAFIQTGQRVDQWAARARTLVDDFAEEIRSDRVETRIVFDQNLYTEARLKDLTRNFAFSALIVFVALFLVMGWRAAFIVGSALPLTVCLVLILFNVFGMPLHQMSVTGLIISLGLLIDNAVVVVDDFDQLRARGAGRLEAIDRALKHLFGPLFASTLTTALAFAPIALLPGSAGEFVGMIGISVIFAVVASLLVSMTVIPAMAGWFDRARAGEGGRVLKRRWWRDGIAVDMISDGYRWSVGAVLRFPPLGIVIGLAPAITGFYLAGQLPSQFFPQTERNQFQIEISLAANAPIGAAEQAVEQASEILRDYDEITDFHFTLGEPGPRVYYNLVNSTRGVEGVASGWVTTRASPDTRAIIAKLQAALRDQFPGAQALALPFEQGPPSDAPIQFLIAGDNLQTLSALGDEVRSILAQTPGVTYTSASLELGTPTLNLEADETAIALTGLRLTGLASDISAELEGVLAGSVLEGVEELPVRVIAPDDRRSESVQLQSKTFGGAPLSALGELSLEPKVASITRRDGQRINDIRAYLEPYTLPAPVFDDFRARLDASGFSMPPGYELRIGGEAENSADALGDLAATGVPLILIMTGAVALVFNSFRMALLILTTGFLSMGLAFFGVWLFNLPLGFNAIIGALGLLGIAINGSIVVLSMLRANREAMSDNILAQRETVMNATRHIVATTLTTIGGFVPLLLTADAFWMPLASAIAGGVAGSALLALYFTPAVFRLTTMRPFTRFALSLVRLLRRSVRPAQ